jgi:hypothetical protein
VTIRLKTSSSPILSHDMKDGDVGVITEWSENNHYIGRIVQRFGQDMVALGMNSRKGWCGWFTMACQKDCRVRLLQSGDVLEVA